MTSKSPIDSNVRNKIIADPTVLLEDPELMRALVAAKEQSMGDNIVDLRGIAMERLEARLDRLEDTHRTVIAAAYENLASTNQVHRAVLRLMDATKFEVFLQDLSTDVANTLRVDCMRLVLESRAAADDPAIKHMGTVLSVVDQGYIDTYVNRGRSTLLRQVTLRQIETEEASLYGEKANFIKSEACLKLDFGMGRLPGMLTMGSKDPHQFTPQQGTDLLTFFAGMFERAMRRWLS